MLIVQGGAQQMYIRWSVCANTLCIDEYIDAASKVHRPLIELDQLDAFAAFLVPLLAPYGDDAHAKKDDQAVRRASLRVSERQSKKRKCCGSCGGSAGCASAARRAVPSAAAASRSAVKSFGAHPLFDASVLGVVRQFLGVRANPPIHRALNHWESNDHWPLNLTIAENML